MDAELVGEALVRRYPDMLWRARSLDGARRARKERQDAIDRIDLPATILELEKVRSVEGTLAARAALQRVARESGGEYDRFMAECVGQMLVSKKRITEEQMKGATQ